MTGLIVRAELERLGEIMAIENAVFSLPWSEEFMRSALAGEGYISLAALVDGRVAGYLCLMSVLDEGEIQNVAVSPGMRRQGLGEALLGEAIAISRREGLMRLFLEVRESNAPARSLYSKLGFTSVGRRKNYYSAPREDAILMMLPIIGRIA